jgi:plastocyanin
MHHHLRTLALGVGTCAVIALVSCGGSSTGPPTSSTTCSGTAAVSGLGTVAATIDATDNLVFVPASTTTQVGDVVEFKNTGTVAHTVTFQDANDGCLSDAMLNPGSTWEVKFTAAGTYNYLCTIHAPNMKGEITVTGS